MQKTNWLILLTALVLSAHAGGASPSIFEYPTAVLDLHSADKRCWRGMDVIGDFPVTVIPERWLVGPPLSAESAVSFPTSYWIDLGFSGRIVGGEGADILLIETGKAGEEALLFLTDGADQEYLLTKVVIEGTMQQELSYIQLDIDDLDLPFEPRAIRLVGLDRGGRSPGFDLCSVQARISRDCGVKACYPAPPSGATGIPPGIQLNWAPGSLADRHVVYFSDVASQVEQGALAARYPVQSRDVTTFDPPDLLLGRTYFWRVDGLGPTGEDIVYEGDIWSFTVADRIVIDDFETYAHRPPIREVWHPEEEASLGLIAETLDTCQHSMVLYYTYDHIRESRVSRQFDPAAGQDWTRSGARVLQLLVQGDLPDPSSGELYVTLTDGANSQSVSPPVTADIEDKPPWRVCRVPLADFDEIDLSQVRGLALGVRTIPSIVSQPLKGGAIHIAEIGLYAAVCLREARPRADLNADCRVDYRDLAQLAADWLHGPTRVQEVARPEDPILWYELDGNADDLMGRAHGQIVGRCNFVPGVYGQAIQFNGLDGEMIIPQAGQALAGIDGITIAFWQWGDDSGHRNSTVLCSDYVHGQSNPAIAVHLGCWSDPGYYRWDCGFPWSFENRLAGRHRDKSDWAGRWNHWAFTKDTRIGPAGESGRMEIYLNGELYDQRTGTDTPITGITSLHIGTGWYGHYDGLIDDVQIYDYALSAAEIAFVATDGHGLFERPASPADLNADGHVDLHDFAALAAEWLRDGRWP
jgi:hypothetical protein